MCLPLPSWLIPALVACHPAQFEEEPDYSRLTSLFGGLLTSAERPLMVGEQHLVKVRLWARLRLNAQALLCSRAGNSWQLSRGRTCRTPHVHPLQQLARDWSRSPTHRPWLSRMRGTGTQTSRATPFTFLETRAGEQGTQTSGQALVQASLVPQTWHARALVGPQLLLACVKHLTCVLVCSEMRVRDWRSNTELGAPVHTVA